MKIRAGILAIVTMAIILGGVAIASQLGLWVTKGSGKTPATIKTGEFAGLADPADIRGSYYFGDIATRYGVPLKSLGEAFVLPDPNAYASFQCKNLETIFAPLAAEGKDVGTASVRFFVALYTGRPITLTETVNLPQQAVDILLAEATLTEQQIAEVMGMAIEVP